MSGPEKKYTGGNVNFLIEKDFRIALDVAAKRTKVRRSDVMRQIVEHWYLGNGWDVDPEVQDLYAKWLEDQERINA